MILDKTVSTNKFVHIDIKKDNKKCIVCWRELPKGSSAKMLIKDDTVYSNSVYCPKGTKHIDNVSDYKEYLRKHKNITDEQKLILLAEIVTGKHFSNILFRSLTCDIVIDC